MKLVTVAKKSRRAPAAKAATRTKLTKPAKPAKASDKVQSLEAEVVRLRAENARLSQELEQYIEQWETLDGPQVSTLAYLCEHGGGVAARIARGIDANIQIVESSLIFLHRLNYVRPASAGKAGFCLAAKGERYLRSRGLLK